VDSTKVSAKGGLNELPTHLGPIAQVAKTTELDLDCLSITSAGLSVVVHVH